MPSKSKAQRNLMAAAAHNPAFAKKVGVPMSVALAVRLFCGKQIIIRHIF